MKKPFCMLLALVLCLGLLPAFAAAEEPVKLTIAVREDIAVEDWETNEMTRYLEEAGNFDLEFMILPTTDYHTKLELMILDGGKDLPDILMVAAPSDSLLYAWAKTGQIIPLTEYYEDEALSANIREGFERTGVDWRSQITMPDGEIYSIASLNQSYGNEHPLKLFMYTPFLDALGLEVPTTTDELYEVFKAVVEGDPNGNGIKDEIGMLGTELSLPTGTNPSGWFRALMNSFVYAGDGEYLTVEDGRVGVAYNTEAWKKGLEYMAKLCAEGLIAPESFTNDLGSFKATFNSEDPTVFMMCFYTATGMLDGASSRNDEYTGMFPVAGPDGVGYITYRPTIAYHRMVVTSNCENPEAAFRLGDLLSSELMGISSRWGQQGVDWDYIADVENPEAYEGMYETAGFDKYIVCYDDAAFWSSGTPQNRSWRQTGPYVRQYAVANGQAMEKGTLTFAETMLAEYQYALHNGGQNPEEVIPKLIYTDEESVVKSELQPTLGSYMLEYASNVVVGNLDLEDTWESYLAELEIIGLTELLEVNQAAYDRMYK